MVLEVVAHGGHCLFQVISIGAGMDLIAIESKLALRGEHVALLMVKGILSDFNNRFRGSAQSRLIVNLAVAAIFFNGADLGFNKISQCRGHINILRPDYDIHRQWVTARIFLERAARQKFSRENQVINSPFQGIDIIPKIKKCGILDA